MRKTEIKIGIIGAVTTVLSWMIYMKCNSEFFCQSIIGITLNYVDIIFAFGIWCFIQIFGFRTMILNSERHLSDAEVSCKIEKMKCKAFERETGICSIIAGLCAIYCNANAYEILPYILDVELLLTGVYCIYHAQHRIFY